MDEKWLIRRLLRILVLGRRIFSQRFINISRHILSIVVHRGFQITSAVIPLASLVAFCLVVYDLGFNSFYIRPGSIFRAVVVLIILMKLLLLVRFAFEWWEPRKWHAHLFSFGLVALLFYLHRLSDDVATMPVNAVHFMEWKLLLYAGITFIFLTESSHVLRFIYRRSVRPSFLFIASFFAIILIGTALLLLPNATVRGISPVDALFTSASAVCVTGLVVVDTATHFTLMGKIILLGLIQIGGLGIMAFTGLLSYLAAGSVSFQSQLALKDMFHSSRMSNVIQFIFRIIIVTLFFESLGIILIRWTVSSDLFATEPQRLFFAVFHSVSAFCNAGFSTLSDGLFDRTLRFNYSLQITIAMLVILGGLGFPIILNIFTYVRVKMQNAFRNVMGNPYRENFTHVIQITSRMAIAITGWLLLAGMAAYFLLEQEATLSQHPTLWGKLVTSFFGSVTPRTAGFNTVDYSALSLPMIIIYLMLMWVGASPGSTGGGIKTTTIGVAFLNLMDVVKGRDRSEVYHVQISKSSIRQAFAIMLLSLLVIVIAIFLISITDGDKGLLKIAFESFSAFSTVGLTLGITSSLTDMSKLVLIFVMFIGRVGALTVLIALIAQARKQPYQYPNEEVIF